MGGIGEEPPLADIVAEVVDERAVVLLFLGLEPGGVEIKCLLTAPLAARLGNRGDEVGLPPGVNDALRGLPRLVELPVAGRKLVRRVENRVREKGVSQA